MTKNHNSCATIHEKRFNFVTVLEKPSIELKSQT